MTYGRLDRDSTAYGTVARVRHKTRTRYIQYVVLECILGCTLTRRVCLVAYRSVPVSA